MAHPKKHQSKSQRGGRRAHHALKSVNLTVCAECKGPVRPHRACASCGNYKGKKVA
ncbi:MAG: 50S ribosomal protein L32 [Candidatus Paceibacterota bacterium]